MAGPEGSRYYNVFLDFSLSLNHKEEGTIITEQEFRLMNLIHEKGSVETAAREMDISTGEANIRIERAEKVLGFSLVEDPGGSASLNSEGLKLIESHNRLRSEIDQAINKNIKRFFIGLNR